MAACRSFCFLLLPLGLAACPAWAQSPPSPRERGLIETCLLALPTKVQVAAAIIQGDSVRFIGAERTATGIRYVENRTAVFEIGSITKIFTATLLAQQVAQGRLRLDEPVRRLVPFELKRPGRGGVDVTLQHLVSHTSGLTHQPPGLNLHAMLHLHAREPFRDYDNGRFENFLRREMALGFTPGTAYQYSNMGMSLVGYVLARRTGRDYETLLQQDIFGPLGMTSSTTDITKARARVVAGVEKEGVVAPNWDMNALSPAGGILTSAQDFARFVRAQFEPDSAYAMTQRPIFRIEDNYRVGMGWHMIDRTNGVRWLNHGGGMAGYTAIVNVDVKHRRGVVVLSNLGNAHKLAENVSEFGRALLRDLDTAR